MEVTVLVPPNVHPGGEVVFEANGKTCSAIVPEGLVEGDSFAVLVSSEPPAPAWLDELLDTLVHDKFTAVLDSFVSQHCSKFLAGGADGYSLQQTAVHQSYQRFFESRIEMYLRKAGVSQAELMDALCRAEADCGPKHALSTSLLTVQNFEQFASMMQQRAIESS